ncbi:MAG TPA: heme lyase CcmF/NrfE family subunit [Candidatus Eremiobacteraceae bacterium]|nr:heme lyase CcmF/NrfE family subunit [Candidatus Eremiobacteraceae bacterium]
MDVFGSFALLLAFVCAVYAFVGGIAAIYTRHPLLVKSTRQAGIATCALIFTATFSLEYLFFSDNFSAAYVVSHSNRSLPTFYKIAALWSGQEGSLLFWSFLLSVYVISVLLVYRNKNGELMPYVGVVLAGVQIFFLTLNNFVASPFKSLGMQNAAGGFDLFTRIDGNGLNPLLQYPEMVIHPPNLYSGYTGFTIPFAFALAALLARYPGEKWIHLTRKWTMIAWCFQTVGILLGAHWAYAVLGWGGYWAWDPVENASLLPWLTGTAFLHSVMMQEKRGMMKVWNVWLVFTTFLLCILGTFLTRSGVVSSVHAFAQSSIGSWFVGFMIVIFGVCFIAYAKNRDYLKSENQLDSVVSRESSFLFNNLILLVSCIAVLSGTLFPVFSEWISGSRISVGTPFFNKVNIPIGLLLMFLTGIGPLLAWRKTSTDSLKRNFGWPLLVAVILGAALFIAGMRQFYSLVCFMLCTFVTATISMEFYRGARVIKSRGNMNLLSAGYELAWRNTRRYGGYIVHMGMVLIFIGLAGAAFNRDVQKDMQPGSTMQIGPYTLLLQSSDAKPEKNYNSERMIVEVIKNNKPMMLLYPERRFFTTNEQSGTMVAIYSTLLEDLYVVYAGQNPETNTPVIHAYLNPLVKWIWLGGVIVVMGTIVALMPNRRSVFVLSAAQQPAGATPAAPALQTSATYREGHD